MYDHFLDSSAFIGFRIHAALGFYGRNVIFRIEFSDFIAVAIGLKKMNLA